MDSYQFHPFIPPMKTFLKKLVYFLGFEVRRRSTRYFFPGSSSRPIGRMDFFLEDIKARGFYPDFILDVGAHKGNWTVMAKQVFLKASFLMVEPQPEMKDFLDVVCSKNEDISWIKVGLGSESGVLVQTIWKDLAGSSFLPVDREDFLLSGKQRKVEVVTVDSLLLDRKLRIPDLVKLDVQGFELEVLRGAESLFGTTEVFIIEVSLYSFMNRQPLVGEVISFMRGRGYEIYDISGFLRRPLDGALGQVDLVFVVDGGFLRRSNEWSSIDSFGTSEAV